MIDGTMGFHEILSKQKSCLALTRIFESARQIIDHLDSIIKKTYEDAPVRQKKKSYMLDMGHGKEPTESTPERLLERRLFNRWRLKCQEEFLPGVCRCFAGYQVPLANEESDMIWGKIDLLGVSPQGLPVVVELKQENSKDSPLMMLVEAAKYAIALRKAWNDTNRCLRKEWCKSIERVMAASAPKWPDELQTVPIICAAPRAYWRQRRGKADVEPNALPKEAWKALADLMSALNDKGFPVTLVEFDAKNGVGDEPMIDQVASFAPPV